MTKDITPEINSAQNRENAYSSSAVNNKYIDKGNLTSRECGGLVKNMVEDYERRFFINESSVKENKATIKPDNSIRENETDIAYKTIF